MNRAIKLLGCAISLVLLPGLAGEFRHSIRFGSAPGRDGAGSSAPFSTAPEGEWVLEADALVYELAVTSQTESTLPGEAGVMVNLRALGLRPGQDFQLQVTVEVDGLWEWNRFGILALAPDMSQHRYGSQGFYHGQISIGEQGASRVQVGTSLSGNPVLARKPAEGNFRSGAYVFQLTGRHTGDGAIRFEQRVRSEEGGEVWSLATQAHSPAHDGEWFGFGGRLLAGQFNRRVRLRLREFHARSIPSQLDASHVIRFGSGAGRGGEGSATTFSTSARGEWVLEADGLAYALEAADPSETRLLSEAGVVVNLRGLGLNPGEDFRIEARVGIEGLWEWSRFGIVALAPDMKAHEEGNEGFYHAQISIGERGASRIQVGESLSGNPTLAREAVEGRFRSGGFIFELTGRYAGDGSIQFEQTVRSEESGDIWSLASPAHSPAHAGEWVGFAGRFMAGQNNRRIRLVVHEFRVQSFGPEGAPGPRAMLDLRNEWRHGGVEHLFRLKIHPDTLEGRTPPPAVIVLRGTRAVRVSDEILDGYLAGGKIIVELLSDRFPQDEEGFRAALTAFQRDIPFGIERMTDRPLNRAHPLRILNPERLSPDQTRVVYLLIGQSNMAGRAEMKPEDLSVIPGADLFHAGGGWEAAMNPLNRYSTIRKDLRHQKLGPGHSFAIRMRELRPDERVGLVVNAQGGTSIRQWGPGTEFFQHAVARTRAAVAEDNSRLGGILWHQGESDGNRTATYLAALTELVESLRKELEAPELPFVAGMVEKDGRDGRPLRAINDVIASLPSALANTAVVSSTGLLTFDGTHFDRQAQLELGRRYADTLNRLLP